MSGTLYNALRARGNLSGRATRPPGSDSYPPAAGTVVPWVLSQPVQDLLTQGKRNGWANLGTIGNPSHLRLHGGHTPWCDGCQQGILYAKDTAVPPWVRDRFRALCASDYNTRWIAFWNLRGRQYDNAGNDLGPSDDEHLHISVRAGHELRHVTLFDDLGARPRPPLPTPKDTDMSDLFLAQQTGSTEVWLTDYFRRKLVDNSKDLANLVEKHGKPKPADDIRDYGDVVGTKP